MTDAFPALPEFWREVFDRAPAAISVVAPDGRQLAGNAAYASLFGYTPSEVERLHVTQLTRPEDQQWTEGYIKRLRDGEIDAYATEKMYVRSDGSTFRAFLDVRAVRRDGRLRALIGVIVPVREREPLGSGRLRKVIEHIHDTITLLDADGTVMETTGRYTPILGYPPEFWEHRSLFDLVLPDEVPRLVDLREQVLARPGEVVHTTMSVRDVGNQVQLLDAHAVNLLHDPDVGGIVVTTRNITSQQELLAQLRDSRDEAVAEAELRSRMLAMVSHELRNPLHALQGISELLTVRDLPDDARQLAVALDRQLHDLTRVVDDLLTTSRIELGSMRVEIDDVDIRALVDDVVATAAVSAGRGVAVVGSVDDDVPTRVRTDPVRLRQVLTNLVGNAVKFTDTGSVQVVVRPHSVDRVVLQVIDTGTGIPHDEHATIFEPFRSSSTAGRSAGAGLGLSIVERIVTILGGTIALSSAPGTGSTFTVELPIAASTASGTSRHRRGPDRPPALLTGLEIVVIEDDPVNQEVTAAQLESLGATCHVAGSGEEGIELLDALAAAGHRIDVVLMDHHLPGIDGTEAVRRIRAAESSGDRRVPIIGITADALPGDRERSLAAGMDDHLVKPVGLVQLSTAIVGVLDPATDPATDPRTEDSVHEAPLDVADGSATGATLGVSADEVRAALDRLVADIADRSVAVSVVEVFIRELPARVEGLVTAVTHGDGDSASRIIHTLAPGAQMLGVAPLTAACRSYAAGAQSEAVLRHTAAAAADTLRTWAAGSDS